MDNAAGNTQYYLSMLRLWFFYQTHIVLEKPYRFPTDYSYYKKQSVKIAQELLILYYSSFVAY